MKKKEKEKTRRQDKEVTKRAHNREDKASERLIDLMSFYRAHIHCHFECVIFGKQKKKTMQDVILLLLSFFILFTVP